MSDDIDYARARDHNPLSPEVIFDPEVYWRALREQQPVHHFVLPDADLQRMSTNPFATEPTTEFWTVLRYADAVHVLTNPTLFPSAQGPGPDRMAQSEDGGVLIFADGQTHLRQRRLAAKAFTPRALERVVPQIQSTMDALVDRIAGKGEAELMSAVAVPLSISTILQIMALPADMTDEFHRWGTAITNTFGGDPAAVAAGGAALGELFAYLQQLIDAFRAGNESAGGSAFSEGVLASLIRAEHEGTGLSDLEICQIAMQLIVAGYETTSTAIVNGVHALCAHPDQRQLFIDGDADLKKQAIEEILRFAGPQAGLFRTAGEDVEIGGCPIPKNGKVRVSFASANRDGAAFTDAEQFRTDRGLSKSRAHLAFGQGPHACIGAALARAELSVAFETLFRRLPGLELDLAHVPVRNTTMLTINGYRALHVRWDPATAV